MSTHLSRLRFIRRRLLELGHKPPGLKLDDAVVDDQSGKILGAVGVHKNSDQLWMNLGLGPEQVAQYNREFSKVRSDILCGRIMFDIFSALVSTEFVRLLPPWFL